MPKNSIHRRAISKFDATFDVTTSATHFDLPFDAAPPSGLDAGSGVSVDALFSPDNWKTTIEKDRDGKEIPISQRIKARLLGQVFQKYLCLLRSRI